MNEEVGGDEGKRRRHGRKGERDIDSYSSELTICELQYSCQQPVGSVVFLWTEPPVVHVGQTHWQQETLPEVKGQKGYQGN